MKFTVPFNPVSAARPNWSNRNGRATRAFMPKKYREWRSEVSDWFEEWLASTDYALVEELRHLPDGRPIRQGKADAKERPFQPDFYGYVANVVFYVETKNSDKRPFPLATTSSDLDNYYKAVTDMMFESDTFKNRAKLNDRWIQKNSCLKVTTKPGTGHIDVDIHVIDINKL